jgi:glycosyltransferase involved in cell wall biosynthesis
MTKLPISVCIVAGNEARRIRRALDSVTGWTSELILAIDDKVTDGSDKIAEGFGAKVFCKPWEGHSAHRNFASGQATQPWLLGLDADEVVSPKLRDEIISALTRSKAKPLPEAYSFPRCTFFCGRWIRHGDWYPDRKVRLWRRGQGHWCGGHLHEKLIVNGRIEPLHGDLLHYSMDNLDHFTRKSVTVSNLFVRQKLECGQRASRLEMGIRPWWRFMRGYLLRLGFLDGWQGYAIARMIAFETFLRYAKLREAQAENAGNNLRS